MSSSLKSNAMTLDKIHADVYTCAPKFTLPPPHVVKAYDAWKLQGRLKIVDVFCVSEVYVVGTRICMTVQY